MYYMRTLDRMRPGETGTVLSLRGEGAVHQRLQEMGVLEGTEVEVVRLAPLGDPMQIRLLGYHLLIRKSEAALIEMSGATESNTAGTR